MSRRIEFLLCFLCFLYLTSFAQTGSAPATPDSAQKKVAALKTTAADSTTLLQSLEKHPVLIGLIGTLIGVIVTLFGMFVRQTRKARAVAKASKVLREPMRERSQVM